MQRSPAEPNEVVDDLVEVGVGHDDAMVLGASERLHALAVRGAARVDILSDVGRADEAHRLDVVMVEDRVDHLLVAVDDVEDPVGKPGLLHQLGEANRNRRVALRRLQDKRIAAGDRRAEHPHRDHRREIERSDSGADSERLAHRIDVDSRSGALGIFALEHMRDPAAEFDDLEAALDVALGVGDDLAVFGREEFGEFLHVGLHELLEPEHDTGAPLRVGRRPGRLRRIGGVDRPLKLLSRAEPDLRLDLAAVGVEHVAGPAARLISFAGDEMVDVTQHDIRPEI
jgi:hypothetical protein